MILVLWSSLAWACPWWAPKAPALKPVLCESRLETKYFIADEMEQAIKKAQELGPSTEVTVLQLWYNEKGRRGTQVIPLEWRVQEKEK